MLESAYHQELVRTPAQFEPIAETAYAPPSDAIDPAFVPSTVVEVSSGQDFLLGDQNLDSKINSFRENLRKIKARNIQNPAEITLMAIQNRFLNSILNQTEPRPVTIGGQPKPTSSSPDAIEGFAPGGNPNSIDLLIQKYGELQPNFANRAKETADQPESRFEEFGIDDLESAQAEPKFELVSENLAKIHARQGNTAKALQIYQQLKLKYPEKSSYFEAQIQTLRA
jgi:hypothetical protein